MVFPPSNVTTQYLTDDLFDQKEINVGMLRLDEIHPVISGNKLFKLYYFMQKALQEKNGIVTFGGAYSNHLVATACLCKDAGLKCTGIVRGERPLSLSHTLIACIEYGMTLKFISRQEYDQKDEPDFLQKIKEEYKNYLVIPEGGYDPLGAAGAALIMSLVKKDASHICCAVGTATTLSGLSLALKNNQQLIGIPVLKNMHDLQQRMSFLTEQLFNPQQLQIIDNYHFGGYAKRTPELISFMNFFYQKHALPTDFVYTGKLMFGIIDSIKKDFFPKGSNIICIHTGGLQGNLSLPKGSLVF